MVNTKKTKVLLKGTWKRLVLSEMTLMCLQLKQKGRDFTTDIPNVEWNPLFLEILEDSWLRIHPQVTAANNRKLMNVLLSGYCVLMTPNFLWSKTKQWTPTGWRIKSFMGRNWILSKRTCCYQWSQTITKHVNAISIEYWKSYLCL